MRKQILKLLSDFQSCKLFSRCITDLLFLTIASDVDSVHSSHQVFPDQYDTQIPHPGREMLLIDSLHFLHPSAIICNSSLRWSEFDICECFSSFPLGLVAISSHFPSQIFKTRGYFLPSCLWILTSLKSTIHFHWSFSLQLRLPTFWLMKWSLRFAHCGLSSYIYGFEIAYRDPVPFQTTQTEIIIQSSSYFDFRQSVKEKLLFIGNCFTNWMFSNSSSCQSFIKPYLHWTYPSNPFMFQDGTLRTTPICVYLSKNTDGSRRRCLW
jgi:hypothetical protein